MTPLFFTFMENGFLFSNGRRTIHTGLPAEIENWVKRWEPTAVLTLLHGDDGAFYAICVPGNSNARQVIYKNPSLNEQFPSLTEFIGRELDPPNVVTAGDDFVAWQTKSTEWHGKANSTLCKTLEDGIRNGDRIKCVALGPGEAFVVLWHDESGPSWDLPDEYKYLMVLLKKHRDLEFIALNPYQVGQFFLVYNRCIVTESGDTAASKRTVSFEMDEEPAAQVQEMLGLEYSIDVITSPPEDNAFPSVSSFSWSSGDDAHVDGSALCVRNRGEASSKAPATRAGDGYDMPADASSTAVDGEDEPQNGSVFGPRNKDDVPDSASTTTQPENRCLICLDAFGDFKVVDCTTCKQKFHRHCLADWVSGRYSNPTQDTTACPCCRTKFSPALQAELKFEDGPERRKVWGGAYDWGSAINVGTILPAFPTAAGPDSR